jgi:metal-dependent amidase/aminoacylase/carboxypeptidase family protein
MTTTSVQDVHTSIHTATRDAQGDLLTASRAIHALAEIGFEEIESSRLLSGLIEQRGFAVELGVSGMPTAFVARRGNTGPLRRRVGAARFRCAMTGCSTTAMRC